MRSTGRVLLPLVIALVAIACRAAQPVASTPTAAASPVAASAPAPPLSTAAPRARDLPAAVAERLVGARVAVALDALKRRDGGVLAALAHPTQGVRFTPFGYVQASRDVRLSAAELAGAFTDTTKRTWGIAASAEPIVLTFGQYHASFIYGRDFASAAQTAYNRAIGHGNTIDNSAEVYSDAILFEAYDPGPDPAMTDVKWQSLRLLFESEAGVWYLVAVVHAEWTI